MQSEAASGTDFSKIRYAQCWEDADILLSALTIKPGDTCLSISSAGDNALAMLSQSPSKVVALDLSEAQLACLELRVAAYKSLEHSDLLILIGSDNAVGEYRYRLYQKCRSLLSAKAARFWDFHNDEIKQGIGSAGKFERYFSTFRNTIMPLVHSKQTINELFKQKSIDDRVDFYNNQWDTWRWRYLFRIFFSRTVMGKLGRSPSFFKYVVGDVAGPIRNRVKHALTQLDPVDNPYLQWILLGYHSTALPYALRPENFDSIRNNIEKIEWHNLSIEEYLETHKNIKFDKYNLSDIFEYMSEDRTKELLINILGSSNSGARLAYWNMLAPRNRPESLSDRLHPLSEQANELHLKDKAFFYSAFILEEVQ